MSAHLRGHHASNKQLTVSVVLKPRNATQLNSLLAALYDPNTSQFHQWLAKGEFNARFAPLASQVAQVRGFLERAGLKVCASSTPFLLQAAGTTTQIEAAFHTTLDDYIAADGQSYFQNDSAVQIPASLSGLVLAVTGLTNTVRLHPHYLTTRAAAQKAGKATPKYGAGPGGSGLAPSQTASIYGAQQVYQLGNRGQGKGATLAVFELSGYTPADITNYEKQFFGPTEHVHLVDINIDGGPITPICPTGDECGPFGPPPCANGCDSADYSGDIEVEADIETQIAIAPKIDRILVYNAPNDFNGTTVVNEYFKIANDDLADSISTSWGLCEQDATLAQAEAESVAFAQMAAQGQSMFDAAGDTGAFDCLRGSGYTGLAVEDPASQPFVTGVGGASFGTFDPGSNLHPSYPTGFETVWNVLDLCSANALGNCANFGAGGGGVSSFWARPPYQYGPGVTSSLSQKAPYCSQAATGQFCRETPDVSANADEFTPYAEYCTGNPKTNSTCATFSSGQTPPGWFGIGGTSLSSPLWSGIIALWDSVHGARFGTANSGLYELFRFNHSYSRFFHDITGKNQTENNNGYYPTTPNYDMATGIGTPRISAIDESNPPENP
ncbi:MAG: S53 family serine peptidase [Ktedonobacteraceae bacterium]